MSMYVCSYSTCIQCNQLLAKKGVVVEHLRCHIITVMTYVRWHYHKTLVSEEFC